MSEVRLEDAKRCPKCKEIGELHLNRKNRDGSKSFDVTCHNDRCPWFNTKWVIDTNPDGSVPEPSTNRRKAYPAIPDRTEAIQETVDRIVADSLPKKR